MADPKYANLPGIAFDQPDVFETNDLPEADQHCDDLNIEEHSDSVETLHISANEAFGKFKDRHLDAGDVDFSDRIRKSKKMGYISWSGEFELAGTGDSETPEQKYQRLNFEVRQLMDELEEAKAAGKDKSGDGKTSLVGLAKQTAALQDQLAGIKIGEILGSAPVKDLQDPSGAAKEKLLAHIQQLKSSTSAKNKSDKNSSNLPEKSGPTDVIYELLMKPDTAKVEEMQRLALFEGRLDALEKALGASADKMSVLSVETNTKSVSAAISVLNSRLSLLDPGHLDHVEGRLAALLQKMNTISEKKVAVEDADKSNKVAELYDLVTANQGISTALPGIVDRLDALQALHEQALQFSKTLIQLDAAQQKLEANLSNNEKVLDDTKAKFSENITTIQKNFDNLDQRLSKLKK